MLKTDDNKILTESASPPGSAGLSLKERGYQYEKMGQTFLDKFRIQEKESLADVISQISKGVIFKGTNLWILILAILTASLGLNVNSAAVIIGAMLISPLMGPIMGIGLGMGISDFGLLKKAVYNYGVATLVSLCSSTVFFLLSPLNEAHSEILARTSPNIYDVLIAFVGGLAGSLATASTHKGNVITGVAIATALMPPLCTAGYGLATLQVRFFAGAFYLYLINSVFIALSTFLMIRLLYFPWNQQRDVLTKKMTRHILWPVVLLTLLPSIYFGYDLVQRDRFIKNAQRFIKAEAHFPNDYLLSKTIDAEQRHLTLVFGGKAIDPSDIQQLKRKLPLYQLPDSALTIKQEFSWIGEEDNTELKEKINILLRAAEQTQSGNQWTDTAQLQRLYAELRTLQPGLIALSAGNMPVIAGDSVSISPVVMVRLDAAQDTTGFPALRTWLKARLQQPHIQLIATQ